MRPIIVLIRKEFQQILRDRPMLAIIFLAPLVQLFILGYAITTDVKHLKLCFVNEDHSPYSRHLEASFRYSGYFDLVTPGASRREAQAAIQDGEADLAVILPLNFSADLERRRSPAVQLLVDGQNSNTSSIGLGYASGILLNFSSTTLLEQMTRSGGFGSFHMIEAQTRVFYNPNLKSVYYMIPGIVMVLLTVTTMMLTAMGVVREKEIGTFEQLMVTPLLPAQLIIGKLVPFAILGFLELSLALTVGTLWFGIPFEGNILLVILATVLFLMVTLGLGLFVSTLSSTQQQALFIAWFMMVFGMLMSGFFYPIENMPTWAQMLTLINPQRWYLAILRAVFLKGSTFKHLYVDYLALAILGVTILSWTIARFRSRLA